MGKNRDKASIYATVCTGCKKAATCSAIGIKGSCENLER
jgi:hypothetical protein